MRGRHRADRTPVWIALEASNKVHSNDIERVNASAQALRAAFAQDAAAIAAGYGIDPPNAERARAMEVTCLQVSRPRMD